jgi:hypothetical protein
MIRELTKSAMSFSWALSLLGIKQAVNLGRSGQQSGVADLFAPVTQMAVGQLDESMKGIYRSGDNLGSRMVDLAFCWLNPLNWLNPTGWSNLSNGVNSSTWARSMMNSTETTSACGCSDPGVQQQASTGAGAGPTVTTGISGGAFGWGPPRSS